MTNCPEFLIRNHKGDFPAMTDIERERSPYMPKPEDWPRVAKANGLTALENRYAEKQFSREQPLQRLADTLGDHFASPLDVLAERFRVLSYGDMIELATGIGADPAKIWEWANK